MRYGAAEACEADTCGVRKFGLLNRIRAAAQTPARTAGEYLFGENLFAESLFSESPFNETQSAVQSMRRRCERAAGLPIVEARSCAT
ncbi:hypothetical protein SAMN03080610_00626 [Afifella marina DSM 2698]|uniref:Uncharacterized protein n=1 Tax=Afifella marina DSM 2698 TaxID=1120955 RepID=A0A1G5MFF5_AFIMA|nr:hypothetical protein SAMN03080610_00626 [Afifella marina DSM 2698]